MPATAGLVIPRRIHLNYERLCAAVQDAASGRSLTPAQQQTLAEVRSLRAQVAAPFDPTAHRPPSPEDRARISGRGDVVITINPDDITSRDAKPTVIRLGADLVSVAIALCDELHINELDAGVLLSDARARASHRADHDVVEAAKELAALRRRESVLYLQEIIRAGLLAPKSQQSDDTTFLMSLMRERDLLVVDHNVFSNLVNRLEAALRAASSQTPPTPDVGLFQKGDLVLLAETVFLLAYTVQLTKNEAFALRNLLKLAVEVHDSVLQRERATNRASRSLGAPVLMAPNDDNNDMMLHQDPEIMSSPLVEIESVRNLLLLSWFCALDRSRYHDVYDPRTGQQDVNQLLKDPSFIMNTSSIPQQDESEDDPVRTIPSAVAAAELCAAVFRLAVAEPDEKEAVTTFLRVSAYGNALVFLSTSIVSWIEKRSGSLSPDADLYADVLEDLAHDIAEAPHILGPVLQFSQHAVHDAAALAAYSAPLDSLSVGIQTPASPAPPAQHGFGSGSARRARPLSTGATMTPSPGRRASSSQASLRGRPPRPPMRSSIQLPPISETGRFSDAHSLANEFVAPVKVKEEDTKPSVPPSDNLLASLSFFVARAISLAPSKLTNESLGGGLRYWVSIGPGNMGFIPRIGDAVVDLWDASMRDAYAPGGVGEAFRRALEGFLELLASTSRKQASPAHAVAVLRYLSEGGHSVVSLDRVTRGMTLMNNRLGTSANVSEAHLDDADVELLRGVADIVAHAAEAVGAHGGIMSLLGEQGKELANCIGSLAIHNVPSRLKEALLRSLQAIGYRRSIVSFLENVARDKAAPLRHFFRNSDAQSGDYDVTIHLLRLVSSVTAWTDDEFPENAVETITVWFAIEEVLMLWSRRKYVHEAHRWGVVEAAGTLIRDIVYRNPNSQRSHRVLARLLTPAPGTGASSFALRTLVCTSGLMRAGDELDVGSNARGQDQLSASLYRISGKDSLIFAAEHGLGDAYRSMQEAARTSSRILSMLLYVPSGRISVPGVVIVSASELLIGELKALSAASSLVFAVDGFSPALSRAGYSPSVCGAVLAMLSKAAHESTNIAAIFAQDPAGGNSSAAQFRTSLAAIISRSVGEGNDLPSDKDNSNMYNITSKEYPDPPIMHSALRIVEACLGSDGGSTPGMFLLGLQMDASNRYVNAEYGVLGALIELVASFYGDGENIRSCATAATFLERLAANTVRNTSITVLEHIRDLCRAEENVRGGGFGDEIIFRLLDAFRDFDPHNVSADIEWSALGELLSGSMSLSALQVRMFPDYERERCTAKTGGALPRDVGDSSELSHKPPSPLELLRLLHTMAGFGEIQILFEAFRTWHHLLGARLDAHERNTGNATIPLLFELANTLLEVLAQPGNGQNLATLVKKDNGEIASAAVLLCIRKLRECDNPNNPGSEEYVADVQCGTLLSGIVRAIAEVSGIGASSSRARTSLYVALLLCGTLSENRVSEEAVARALGGRVGQRQLSGTDVILGAACNDAVSGPTAASKYAAMAAASLIATLDAPRAMSALGSQNRLRRILQSALADSEKQTLISRACSWAPSDGKKMNSSGSRAAVAVAEAAMALVHAIAASGHGARVIMDSGSIDSILSLFSALPARRVSDYRSRREAERAFGDGLPSRFRGLDSGRGGLGLDGLSRDGNHWYGETDDIDATRGEDHDGLIEQLVSMIANITGALAAAVSCSSGMIDSSAMVALGESKEVFTDLLRNVRLAGWHELETIGSLGIILCRISDDVMMGRDGGVNLGGWLAAVIGGVIPAVSSSHQLGGSRSHLSAGINQVEPESARDARRVRIMHPEGGSLFERSVIEARAACAQNVFAALRRPHRVLGLFVPQLSEENKDMRTMRGDTYSKGRLSEVVRICKTMLREVQWAGEECMRLESRMAGDFGTSLSSQRVAEMAEYCQEMHGVERANLSGRVAMTCLREAVGISRKHGDRCISVFESGLFILREYTRAARETVRGRPATHLSMSQGMVSMMDGTGTHGSDAEAQMSVREAEDLLNEAKDALLPVCNDVEGLPDGAWCGKDASFCKQVCRQIRTACTGRS